MSVIKTVSPQGLFALALHEGIVPGPYLDSVRVWTYGVGHTAAAGPPDPARLPRGMPADLDRALRDIAALYQKDIARYADDVARAVTKQLTQYQFDALVSFHYNTGGIRRASLVQRLNRGDYAGAASGFMAWVRPPEITKRRVAEQALFRSGVYPSGRVPVWSVSSEGRVRFTAVRSLTQDEFLALLGASQVPPTPVNAAKPEEPATKPAPFPQRNHFLG